LLIGLMFFKYIFTRIHDFIRAIEDGMICVIRLFFKARHP